MLEMDTDQEQGNVVFPGVFGEIPVIHQIFHHNEPEANEPEILDDRRIQYFDNSEGQYRNENFDYSG